MRKRDRDALLIGSAIGLFSMAVFGLSYEPNVPAAATPRGVRGPGTLGGLSAEVDRHGHRPRPVIEVRRKRLIERVWTEPEEACRGEDAVVRVRLVPDYAEAKVFIQGRAGLSRVLRFEEIGTASIAVLARDQRDALQIRNHSIEVRECDGLPSLHLSVTQPTTDDVVVEASLPDGGALRDVAWDFGDGTTRETKASRAAHSYASRSQDGPTTTFVVLARGTDPAGRAREGRASISFVNPLHHASRGDILWLGAQAERFVSPDRASDGARSTRVSIVNRADTPVSLAEVEFRGFPCTGNEALDPVFRGVGLLSTGSLPARDRIDATLRLPSDLWSSRVCLAEVRLHGRTARGRPTQALFALDIEVPDSARLERDAALRAQLDCARRRVGGDRIGAEDLARLAADGSLADCPSGDGSVRFGEWFRFFADGEDA